MISGRFNSFTSDVVGGIQNVAVVCWTSVSSGPVTKFHFQFEIVFNSSILSSCCFIRDCNIILVLAYEITDVNVTDMPCSITNHTIQTVSADIIRISMLTSVAFIGITWKQVIRQMSIGSRTPTISSAAVTQNVQRRSSTVVTVTRLNGKQLIFHRIYRHSGCT